MTSPRIIPEVVRKAFKVAEARSPAPTHLELPEDVMAAEVDAEPLPAQARRPEPSGRELLKAADLIRGAINPVALAGNGVCAPAPRPRCASSPRHRDPASRDVHGQGAAACDDPQALGTVGLQARDYAMAGFEDADVVLAIGYDLVEHSPEHWNPKRDKKIICIDSVAPEIDAHFIPRSSWSATSTTSSPGSPRSARRAHQTRRTALRDVVLGRFEAAKDDDAFPMQPPRALWEIRQALARETS